MITQILQSDLGGDDIKSLEKIYIDLDQKTRIDGLLTYLRAMWRFLKIQKSPKFLKPTLQKFTVWLFAFDQMVAFSLQSDPQKKDASPTCGNLAVDKCE